MEVPAASGGHFALHGGAVEFAAIAVIIVAGVVQADAIVPQHQHPRLPAQPAGEGMLRDVRRQEGEQRARFGRGHPLDPDRIGFVDIQRLLARYRVGADERVERPLQRL
jgi:hypothetical protein